MILGRSDGRTHVVIDSSTNGLIEVDVEDTHPGGLVPGEERPTTQLVVRGDHPYFECRIPLDAVRAAIARRGL